MGVYNVSGNYLGDYAFNKPGERLSQAYNLNGGELFVPKDSLVVMTYNTQWFTGLNSNQTMQETIFSRYNPDIIGFQEFQRDYLSDIPALAQTLLTDYHYEMGTYGNKNALASKVAFTGFTTIPFTTQTMDGQSYCTATLVLDEKEIFIVSAHVTTSDYESTKVEQVKEVFDALQGHEYFILMADFNTVCKTVSDPEYTTIMKQFVDAGYNCANCTEQHGFIDTWTSGHTSGGTWYPCDHVITSANLTIDTVIADQTKVTYAAQTGQSIDHIPLVAYISLTDD